MKKIIKTSSDKTEKKINRAGRPALSKVDRRTHEFKIRLNESERKTLKQIAEIHFIDIDTSKNVANLLRKIILDQGDQKNVTDTKDFKHLIYQMHKIGININQITHLSHLKSRKDPSHDLKQEIVTMQEQLLEIIHILNSFRNDS